MSIKSTVQDTTGEMLETAEDRIGAFADRAYEAGRSRVDETLGEGKNAFKQFCQTVVRAIRSGGKELRDEGYTTAASLVDDAAGRAEAITREIDDFDMRSTTERVEDFVRERPLVAYGALAVAGFLVANTLQSAAQNRHGREIEPVDPQRRAAAKPANANARTQKKTKAS